MTVDYASKSVRSVAASSIVAGSRQCEEVPIVTKGKLVSQMRGNVNVLFCP